MSCKKIALFLAVFMFSTVVGAAQAQPQIIIPGKTMQKILKRVEKKFEKDMVVKRQQAVSAADTLQAVQAQQSTAPAAAQRANEVCSETGHTHAQAKNHKGPCVWIDLSAKEKSSAAKYSYDPKTGEHTYVHPSGKVWTWKSKPTQKISTAVRDTSSQRQKYPPYW